MRCARGWKGGIRRACLNPDRAPDSHAPDQRPASRNRPPARRIRRHPPRRLAGAGRGALPGLPAAGSRLRPGHRLHGRRCGGGAGGARLVRPRHQEGERGQGPHPLSDPPPPLDPVRDVRDQVPREAADLRGAAVDPPPHRQRERIFRALFDPGPRVLCPGGGESGGAVGQQPAGPRRRAGGQGGGAGARPAAHRRDPRLRPLPHHAERERGRAEDRRARGRGWRASWRA